MSICCKRVTPSNHFIEISRSSVYREWLRQSTCCLLSSRRKWSAIWTRLARQQKTKVLEKTIRVCTLVVHLPLYSRLVLIVRVYCRERQRGSEEGWGWTESRNGGKVAVYVDCWISIQKWRRKFANFKIGRWSKRSVPREPAVTIGLIPTKEMNDLGILKSTLSGDD